MTPSASLVRRFQSWVTLSMAAVTVWAAVVGALQSHASHQQSDADERSRTLAVVAMGELLSAEQQAAHELDVYTRWVETTAQARQARAAAQAARLLQDESAAAAHEQSAARWDRVAEALQALSPLLSDPDYAGDDRIYREQASRQSYLEHERQEAASRASRGWGSKADLYVAVITSLAVVLFLFGLSLTIDNWLRYMFVAVGWTMTAVTVAWVLVLAVVPVYATPEDAMARMVEGQIAVNIGSYLEGDEQAVWYGRAVDELTEAISIDELYASAYEWRAQAQLDARLRDRRFDNAAAAADYRQAIAGGNDHAITYTNLGWALYLADDYAGSIQASQTAVQLKSDECVAHFNLGLALLASERATEARPAYDRAIGCIVEAPTRERDWLFEAAVTDLLDLQYVRPGTDGLAEMLERIKELSAAYELFGSIALRATDGEVPAVRFAENIAVDGTPLDVADTFAPGTSAVYTLFEYRGVAPETSWLVRWYRNGALYDRLQSAEWSYGESGETWVVVYGSPLPPGRYDADFYFNGHRVASDRFDVEAGEAVPMERFTSGVFQLTLNVPVGWTTREVSGEDASLIVSRDERTYLYYYTQRTSSTSRELLQDLQAAWQQTYPDVTFGEGGEFYLGGLPGAVYVTAWHNDASGSPVLTYLIAAVDESGLARLIWMQMPQAGSDETYAQYLLPMIKSIEFAGTGG